jgi:hypothetical protein
MKINDLIIESLVFEIRLTMREALSEAITDYFAQILAKLRRAEELSHDEVQRVSSLIAGIKVLSVPQYRQAMTRSDIGINPNSARELHDLLVKIPKDGKLDRLTDEVFQALSKIAPSIFKKELEEIEALNRAPKQEHEHQVNKLAALFAKIYQAFNKTKTAAANNKLTPQEHLV